MARLTPHRRALITTLNWKIVYCLILSDELHKTLEVCWEGEEKRNLSHPPKDFLMTFNIILTSSRSGFMRYQN